MWYNIILTVGLILLVLAYRNLRKVMTHLRNSRRVMGIVVQLVETRGAEGDTLYTPLFRYTTHNGFECTLQHNVASSPSEWEVGQTATIVYANNEITQAEILSYFPVFRLPVLLAAASSSCLVVGIGHHVAGLFL